ncbi:MAG: hypothetical protein ACRCZB_08295, partial [Bacteroidales bacterium]
MKKFKICMLAFMATILLTNCKDKVIAIADLPDAISSYLATHFADHEILQAKRDKGDNDERYEIL